MINKSDMEVSKALNVLENISDELRYERICRLDDLQKETYAQLLDNFKKLHTAKEQMDTVPANLHNLKASCIL